MENMVPILDMIEGLQWLPLMVNEYWDISLFLAFLEKKNLVGD